MSKLLAFFLAGLVCIVGCRPSHIDTNQQLLKRLNHEKSGERIKAAWDIAEFSPLPAEFVEPLLNLLQHDKEANVREAAAKALRHGEPAVHVKMQQIFKTETDETVRSAIMGVIDAAPAK